MSKSEPKTAISSGGLRYRTKVSGSPFSASGAFGASSMSCFLCGKHRARSLLKTRRLLGKSQTVCSPSCAALDNPSAAPAATTPTPTPVKEG